MKKVRIIALHLAFGGIEKAICSMANLFAERYEVEILSVYHMPDSPAFPLDERVRVRWLLDDIPNRDDWKAALHARDLPGIARESIRAAKIKSARSSRPSKVRRTASSSPRARRTMCFCPVTASPVRLKSPSSTRTTASIKSL